MAERIAELPIATPRLHCARLSPEYEKTFASPRLAETALQLIDPLPGKDETTDEATRVSYALLRGLDGDGHSNVVFGPNGAKLEKGTEVADLVASYSGRRLFQARIVRREALVEIAAALKGIDLFSNAYGNTRGAC